MFHQLRGLLLLSVALLSFPISAVNAEKETGKGIVLKPGQPYFYVTHDGWSVKVERIQDPEYVLRGYFAKTARNCPPFCIQPIDVAPGIKTIGELELFQFMENGLRRGTGLLIDARTPAWHKKGTIPGSTSIPFTIFHKNSNDPEVITLFQKFGATPRSNIGFFRELMEEWELIDTTHLTRSWNFTKAKNLVLWCNGPACGQSPRAIKGLLKLGYPADKIAYYRGGMQMWQLFGLTTVKPGKK